MRNLDRFVATMTYKEFDHPPLLGEGAWQQTVARWHSEGLEDGQYWTDYFGVKCFDIDWHGFNEGMFPRFERKVLEETAEYTIFINESGTTAKDLKTGMSMPEWLEFPVKNRADFEAILPRFIGRMQERVAEDFSHRVARFNSPDFDALLLPPIGAYWGTLRELCGVEVAAYMFYDCPDLVNKLMDGMCDNCCWFMEKFCREVGPNLVCAGTGEDFAFKNGPFISPAMFREFFVPRYSRVVKIAQKHGVELCFIDSDGNYEVLIPDMLKVGMNVQWPFEVAAGMDPVMLRAKYGKKLRMMGGVDKRAVAAGKEAIKKEMDRLFPLMCEGGYIPKIDHSISSDISWDNFRYYMETLLDMHQRCANR
jgi:uroporphyrinogen decarboxylase